MEGSFFGLRVRVGALGFRVSGLRGSIGLI